jgi:hypothetical protein
MTSMAVGGTSKAATLATARTPGMPTSVRTTSMAGLTKLQKRNHSKDSLDVTTSRNSNTRTYSRPEQKKAREANNSKDPGTGGNTGATPATILAYFSLIISNTASSAASQNPLYWRG